MASTLTSLTQRLHCSLSLSQASTTASTNYRPAVILPGLGNNTNDYQNLKQLLIYKYGIPTVVANVSRIDWLRNAAGLLDPNYWRGTLQPRPVLDWYLDRIEKAVQESMDATQGGNLTLIGHSAGGWLARVYLEEFGFSHTSMLLTLGTPHLPPPKDVPGVIDQTRGLLNYVDKNCSKAVYTPQLKYVCIAGRYIQGARMSGNSNIDAETVVPVDAESFSGVAIMGGDTVASKNNITWRARFGGQGYKQVCGLADVWGDGVVPEVSAHLDGALNISLNGVYHSPVGSDDVSRPWYGSPAVVEQWVEHLLN